RVAVVVQIVEVDRIEEAIGLRAVDRAEVAGRLRPAADRGAGFYGGKLRSTDVRVGLRRAAAESGLRSQVNHRADLLAEFRRHIAVDHLDALRDAGIDGVGEGDAGLIGDGLTVDDVLALTVRALEVEAPVLVLGEAGRG